MGDLRADEPIRVLDSESKDLSCDIKCQQLMCFTNNVVRATSEDDFTQQIERKGLRGFYKSNHKGYHSKIFIRWKMTDVCNYTCAYCTDWQTVNKKGTELTDAEMLTAARKIVGQFDSISLRLTGGEPSARRCYIDLMRLFHDNLDRFTDIEIRTNLSYQAKHKEVLSWGWDGKLHLHIGCHIRDKNFMPWRTVELFREAPDADYVLKFVSTPTIRHHVMFFRQYFIDNGIPARNIRMIEEVFRKDEKATELEDAPHARRTLEQQMNSADAAQAQPAPIVEVGACSDHAGANGSSNGNGKRFTLADLRAMAAKKQEPQVDRLDTLPEEQQDGEDCCGKAAVYSQAPSELSGAPA
jgi:organic radical activating enzyme